MPIVFSDIIPKKNESGAFCLKIRKREYGDKNAIGRNVEKIRLEQNISQKDFIARLQANGLDINPTSYSKLEGQIRIVSDKELFYIAKTLDIKMEELFKQ